MIGAAWRSLLSLPSVDQFLSDLASDLVNNRSVILLLPKGTRPGDVSELIADQLFKRNVSYLNYAIQSQGTADLAPESIAADLVTDTSGAVRSLVSLWQEPSFPEVILLDVPDHSPNHWRKILFLMRQWADQMTRFGPELPGPRTLFVPCWATPLLGDLPQENIRLSIRWWWGFPSELEVRLLTRMTMNGGGTAEILSRECLAAAFGAGDAALTSVLASAAISSLEECISLIRAFAKDAGIETNTRVWALQSSPSPFPVEEPPPTIRDDWADGRVLSSFEHGVELHPAVLSLAGDATERLGRRLWRTQSSTLMPLADQVRLRVCEHLVSRYGKKWFQRLGIPPQESRELDRLRLNPLDADLGYLVSVNRKTFFAKGCGYDHELLEFVRLMRNDLAHYRPVESTVVRKVLAGI